jgi:hypothetical protein
MLANLLVRNAAPQATSEARAIPLGDFTQAIRSTILIGGIRYDMTDPQVTAIHSGPLAAVIGVRAKVFSEITFKFQRYTNTGAGGQLFGTPELSILERPWVGAGTSHLLAAMEIDLSVYGNSYWILSLGELVRLDPTCVNTLVTDVIDEATGVAIGKRLVGYSYTPSPNKPSVTLLPEDVAHYRLDSDPLNPFRGTSWMRAIMSDAESDAKMTAYKTALLDNSAVPGLVLRAEPGVSLEQFEKAREMVRERHAGFNKVGRTMMIGAGFDVRVVGSNLKDLDLKSIQGAGETRIAAAAGVPVPIVGFSEGLQGSALNAGNYGAARRRFADGTMRPLWRAACTALSTLVPAPAGARLWFDQADVSFLQEDMKDEAEIRYKKAYTVRTLVDAGYLPDAAAQFAATGDESVLAGQHSGLFSVQLQPPTPDQAPDPAA